jgi:hypothetical protein
MKKNYIFTLLLALCFGTFSFGQGSEDFTGVTLPGSYSDDSFVGNNDITWTYIESRDANGDNNNSGITLPALMLRRSSDDSKITSSTISGGIGDFSMKLYKGFTGAGDRQVELFVNGVSKGTSTPFDDFTEHVFTVTGINVTGDIIIEIKDITSKQVIIDDITWTAAVIGGPPTLTISQPTDGALSSRTTVDATVGSSNFTFSADDGSGASNGSGDGYIKSTFETQGGATEENAFFSTSLPTFTVAPGNTYTLTLELVDNAGDSLTNAVTDTVTFSIEYPCDIALEVATTSCDALNAILDTYTISIPFTGGNTSTYTLIADFGAVGGDNPSNVAEGTITISAVTEGTDVVFTLKGAAENSTCDLTRNITSPTCVPAPTCPAIGAIIVTEIMQNPAAVSDNDGEYFEVYNSTNAPIELQGWVIKSLTTDSKDHTIATSLVVSSEGYVVLGKNSDTNTNGGVTVNYAYSSNVFLGNGSDSIALECGANIIDSVSWDDGATFPDPTGKSMELMADKYTATDNDAGANWEEATAEIVTGGDLGTPGSANSATLTLDENAVLGFTAYPNPITNKEFTISSNSASLKEIVIFNVIGKKVVATRFSETKAIINVSAISAGIYILKVIEAGKTATKKLVIR